MIAEVFHKAKLRLTRPRRLVFQVLQHNQKPQSAQYIHAGLKRQVDLVSVYRSLQLFERLGLVQREHTRGEDYFYVADKPHHHITCTSCGKSECVPCGHHFALKGFRNVEHQLTLKGVCNVCA